MTDCFWDTSTWCPCFLPSIFPADYWLTVSMMLFVADGFLNIEPLFGFRINSLVLKTLISWISDHQMLTSYQREVFILIVHRWIDKSVFTHGALFSLSPDPELSHCAMVECVTIGVMGSLKWNWTSFYYLYYCFRYCIVLCLKYNFGFLLGNKDPEPHCIHKLNYEETLDNVENIINHQFLTESISQGCCNNLLQSAQSYQLISLSTDNFKFNPTETRGKARVAAWLWWTQQRQSASNLEDIFNVPLLGGWWWIGLGQQCLCSITKTKLS